jgi:hypothetical protein
VLNRHDRRDLACLGLLVLVYGLAVAPVVHAVVGHGGGGRVPHVHVHGSGERAHSHGSKQRDVPGEQAPGKGHGPGGHQHAAGSVEHLHALAASWTVVEAPRVRGVSWFAEVLRGPSRAPGSAPRLTAMPQGP